MEGGRERGGSKGKVKAPHLLCVITHATSNPIQSCRVTIFTILNVVAKKKKKNLTGCLEELATPHQFLAVSPRQARTHFAHAVLPIEIVRKYNAPDTFLRELKGTSVPARSFASDTYMYCTQ